SHPPGRTKMRRVKLGGASEAVISALLPRPPGDRAETSSLELHVDGELAHSLEQAEVAHLGFVERRFPLRGRSVHAALQRSVLSDPRPGTRMKGPGSKERRMTTGGVTRRRAQRDEQRIERGNALQRRSLILLALGGEETRQAELHGSGRDGERRSVQLSLLHGAHTERLRPGHVAQHEKAVLHLDPETKLR